MILQEKLKNIEIVLGSNSPRRRELLKSMDIDFSVLVRETDELFDATFAPEQVVQFIAKTKLAAFHESEFYSKLILCADTIVVDHLGKVINKPTDIDDAKNVLQSLSAKNHQVFTAVAISYQGNQWSFVEETKVWFNELSSEEIAYYIEHYKPYDKAGSYGIQEWIGRIGIEKIEGSYENVIGLPTARLQKELKSIFLA